MIWHYYFCDSNFGLAWDIIHLIECGIVHHTRRTNVKDHHAVGLGLELSTEIHPAIFLREGVSFLEGRVELYNHETNSANIKIKPFLHDFFIFCAPIEGSHNRGLQRARFPSLGRALPQKKTSTLNCFLMFIIHLKRDKVIPMGFLQDYMCL